MILLFEDPGILSPYISAALTLWPVWVAIVVAVAGLVKVRVWEKAGISDTNKANIEGLEGLLATRDRELASANVQITDHAETIEDLSKENETLRAEYKTLAGLAISELIHWAGRYEFHVAELESKDSQIRILNNRILIMEQREAENAEIHKSQ